MSLYGVETKALNQAVTRNLGRFPERYSFKLTPEEAEDVRSQIVTLSGESARSAWWRYPPRAFTEQGVAMLSAVLRGAKAVEVSIGIMDAFVEMSPFSSREDLAASSWARSYWRRLFSFRCRRAGAIRQRQRVGRFQEQGAAG